VLEIVQDERILGDKQNGELFAEKFRGNFLFVWPLQEWFTWNGVIWQQCTGGEVEAAAKEISNTFASKALTALRTQGGDQSTKLLFSHAVKAQNIAQIKAMIGLAKSEKGMGETDINKLNADPYLLGVANGVVDLRLGILIPPDPDMVITKQCNANYLPESQCPQWIDFLNQIFEGNQGMIDSVQLLLGYTFTGSVTEEIMVICHGYGANGKSVMSNVIQQIAGGYGKTGAPSLLKARRDDDSSPRSDIAGLQGSRYVSVNEMQSGDRLDEQVVKMLAGRESISARALYRDHMTYKPSGKVWLKTNHKPVVKEDDDGIWRRLIVIPFNRRFSEDERDPNLEEKLLSEADGILGWIIQGGVKWHQTGLRLCSDIKQQSASYRTESDLLGQFIEEEAELNTEAKTLEKIAYTSYVRWISSNGNRPLSKGRFTQKLCERGIVQVKSNSNRYYQGIKLVSSLVDLLPT
jgi:P4 family phage/plasmid primase-like protien